MFDDDRYARQRRLAEIGAAGQERIEKAPMEVRGSEGAIIETEYLYRAGVERVALTPGLEPEPFAHAVSFRFEASRRVAAGAWRALGKLRGALGRAP